MKRSIVTLFAAAAVSMAVSLAAQVPQAAPIAGLFSVAWTASLFWRVNGVPLAPLSTAKEATA